MAERTKKILVKIEDEVKIKDISLLKDLRFWVPTVIAILALLFSMDVFSPFNPQVEVRGAYIRSATSDQEGKDIVFILPIEFLNGGKQVGTIRDIYLNVSRNVSGRYYSNKYIPTDEVDGERLYGEEIWKESPHIISKPFQAFNIFGESTVTKFLLFTSILRKENGTFRLLEGNYVLTIFVKSSNSDLYENKAYLNLNIPREAIIAAEGNNRVFVRNDGTTDIASINGTTII